MTYQTNPTRAEAIWLDCCKRNPKRDGETFYDWLSRLSRLMSESQRSEQVEGGQG